MSQIYFISDHHFHHAGILRFKRQNGEPVRSFKDVEEMNEKMVEAWNSVVKPEDKTYHLGDVVMRPSAEKMKIVGRLNGRKTLIVGNHDDPEIWLYRPYFKKIYSTRQIDELILSHIPIHPLSFGKAKYNVHGHIHNNLIGNPYGSKYFNVSCEVLDYKPIGLEDLKTRLGNRNEA